MLQEFFFIILATANSVIPMPEIASYRDGWGERSFSRDAARYTQCRWIGHTPVPTPASPGKAISANSVKNSLNKQKRWHSTED